VNANSATLVVTTLRKRNESIYPVHDVIGIAHLFISSSSSLKAFTSVDNWTCFGSYLTMWLEYT